MRAAIFDLDGTLADTSADLIAAANACFDTPQLDPVADAATAFAGGRAMLRLGFSRLGHGGEAAVNAQYPRLLAHYADNIDTHTTLYPGVEACLDHLAEAGWALGVCTNKPAALAETLLQRLRIRDRFAAMLGADTLPVRKPDPEHLFETIRQVGGDPSRSVLIGDTITDRDAARNARVPCVLVTFGPEGARVARMQPEGLLSSYAELPDLLDGLLAT